MEKSDVKVKIDLTRPAGRLGFGVPLILALDGAKDYKECGDLAMVSEAGYEDSTDTYKAAALMFGQDDPPSRVAVLGAANAEGAVTALTANAAQGWRRLVVVGAEAENYTAIATYINTLPGKMLFATVASKDELENLGDGDRTVGFVHTDKLAAAALVGEASGLEPGSFTYKNLILRGIAPMELTETELDEIHTAKGITFVAKSGDNVTSEGKTMSGEYIDVVDSEDYIISNLEYDTQVLLNREKKIPYDNNGIAALENAAVNVLRTAYNNGMIATGEDGKPMYKVNYLLREETDEKDRADRRYIGGRFSFSLAGAIHTAEITGEITI